MQQLETLDVPPSIDPARFWAMLATLWDQTHLNRMFVTTCLLVYRTSHSHSTAAKTRISADVMHAFLLHLSESYLSRAAALCGSSPTVAFPQACASKPLDPSTCSPTYFRNARPPCSSLSV